ncbi:MAG: nuclear transport factor 2 family protein [Verrucomicrobia bacterium]|nr:nuclear transport factor 2 family protein [Verrucomicrobiota bacterium]MBS0636193.1 nuclear transport factor 2 family protein [Verrucomicrobiota bacterium]
MQTTLFHTAFLFVICLTSTFSLFGDAAQGEALERQMWEDMKHRNYKDIEEHIAAGFQSVHTDGARTRAEEIQLIKDLYLGSYTITDMKVTEGKDSYIVTYKIAVGETIDAKRLSDKPTPRMSMWQKIDEKWQWIAHANFNPISTGTTALPKAPNPNN